MKAIIEISPVQQVNLGINIGLMGEVSRNIKSVTSQDDMFYSTVKIQGVNVVVYNDDQNAPDGWYVDMYKTRKAN